MRRAAFQRPDRRKRGYLTWFPWLDQKLARAIVNGRGSRRAGQIMAIPPFTCKVWPVM